MINSVTGNDELPGQTCREDILCAEPIIDGQDNFFGILKSMPEGI